MIALWMALALAVEGTVTLPLEAVESVQTQQAAEAAEAIVSRAVWGGRVLDSGAIALDATLHVTLSGDGYKSIPLVGAGAVLEEVRVDGVPVAVDVRGDHYTWHTDAVGTVAVRLLGWVPSSGQRGALEVDLPIPVTPSTRVQLELPREDLKPEILNAVRVRVERGPRPLLTADLEPTNRLHLVGLRDLERQDGRPAELYAETSHLVSVEDHRIEIFAVVRYSILYGSARRFEVFVPDGLTVVEADGEGGLAYELEPVAGGVVLRGETQQPVRNQYELSLRLEQRVDDGAQQVELPRARGVERERGWVGLEVPGRVRLTDPDGGALQRVPIQQLPADVREASVSPILDAWRLGDTSTLSWTAHRLPAVEVSSERIDQVWARTVVAAGGRVVTELSMQLQNRSRHGLTLALPDGVQVTRATRDGMTVVPAAAEGGVVLPLRRTRPGEAQRLTVLLSQEGAAPGWWGQQPLALPTLDLPVADLSWEVHLPESHHWFPMQADVASQTRAGSGSWLAEGHGLQQAAQGAPTQGLTAPNTTVSCSHHRYWLDAHAPVNAQVRFAAPWLWGLLRLLGLGGLAGLVLAGVGLAWRWRP